MEAPNAMSQQWKHIVKHQIAQMNGTEYDMIFETRQVLGTPNTFPVINLIAVACIVPGEVAGRYVRN